MMGFALLVAWFAIGLIPMLCFRNWAGAVLLPVAIWMTPILWIAQRMEQAGEYVCVSGKLAKTYGEQLRLVRRDGALVPCLTPTGIAPNRSENETNSRGGAEKRGVVLTGFARLDDTGRQKS